MIKENKTHFCLLKENDLIVGRFFFFFLIHHADKMSQQEICII